jgi:hypothetical protein
MHTVPAQRVDELPSVETQVSLHVLEALSPMSSNLAYIRVAGLVVTVPEHIEAEYVAKHGEKAQGFIDVLLGRKDANLSVIVKVWKRLGDFEKVAIRVLEDLEPMYPNLAVARKEGLVVTVPEDIEAAYVAKHGEKGQWFIDVLLGRKETIASVNVKVFMRLEDPETVAQWLREGDERRAAEQGA